MDFINDYVSSITGSSGFILLSHSFILFLFLLWLGTIRWAIQDSQKRDSGANLTLAAILLTVMLPFLGILVYSVMRPPQTLDEVRTQKLEHVLLKSQLYSDDVCPECHAHVEKNHKYCTHCGSSLVKKCPSCRREVKRHWNFCSHCNTTLQDDLIFLSPNPQEDSTMPPANQGEPQEQNVPTMMDKLSPKHSLIQPTFPNKIQASSKKTSSPSQETSNQIVPDSDNYPFSKKKNVQKAVLGNQASQEDQEKEEEKQTTSLTGNQPKNIEAEASTTHLPKTDTSSTPKATNSFDKDQPAQSTTATSSTDPSFPPSKAKSSTKNQEIEEAETTNQDENRSDDPKPKSSERMQFKDAWIAAIYNDMKIVKQNEDKEISLYEYIRTLETKNYQTIKLDHKTYYLHTLVAKQPEDQDYKKKYIILKNDTAQTDAKTSVLVCSNLDWHPKRIINQYIHRLKKNSN